MISVRKRACLKFGIDAKKKVYNYQIWYKYDMIQVQLRSHRSGSNFAEKTFQS